MPLGLYLMRKFAVGIREALSPKPYAGTLQVPQAFPKLSATDLPQCTTNERSPLLHSWSLRNTPPPQLEARKASANAVKIAIRMPM